jgi:hypothetical protein
MNAQVRAIMVIIIKDVSLDSCKPTIPQTHHYQTERFAPDHSARRIASTLPVQTRAHL